MTHYGGQAIATWLSHCGVTKPFETLSGKSESRDAMVTSNIHGVGNYQLWFNKPGISVITRFTVLVSNDMVIPIFPSLSSLLQQVYQS